MLQKNKKRIEYIDALRGLMILMVVYCHLTILGRSDILSHTHQLGSNLDTIISKFRMPLFFFISGFFVYSRNYSFSLFKKRATNRIIKQLYPTLLIGLVFCVIHKNSDFIGMLYNQKKYGYWFTISAVQMFFMAVPILLCLNVNKSVSFKFHTVIISFYTLIVEILAWITMRLVPSDYVNLFGIEFFLIYFPFFIGGMLFKINYEYILSIITNKFMALGCFISFVLGFYFLNSNIFKSLILGFSAIIVMHYLSYKIFNHNRIKVSKVSKFLQYIGTMTLEIYLIHYFFVAISGKLPHIKNFIAFNLDTWWEFPLVFVISIIVAILCLAVIVALKHLKVYNLIFPNVKKKDTPPHNHMIISELYIGAFAARFLNTIFPILITKISINPLNSIIGLSSVRLYTINSFSIYKS